MKSIEKTSTILDEMIKKKLSLCPQKSLSKIQDEVPDQYIFTLHRSCRNNYIARCINDDNKITKPTGIWLFVVTTEAPCNVIMISQDDINRILLSSSFIGLVGIGHTSLTRKKIDPMSNEQCRKYIKERTRLAHRLNRNRDSYAIDVYLAGEIMFNEFGEMVNWNNNSGHYKISKENSMINIPAPLKRILPIELFVPYNN